VNVLEGIEELLNLRRVLSALFILLDEIFNDAL